MRWRLRHDGKRKDEVNVKCAADTREAEEEAAEEVEEAGGSGGDAEEVAAAADSETASAAVTPRASNTEGGGGGGLLLPTAAAAASVKGCPPARLPAPPAISRSRLAAADADTAALGPAPHDGEREKKRV